MPFRAATLVSESAYFLTAKMLAPPVANVILVLSRTPALRKWSSAR